MARARTNRKAPPGYWATAEVWWTIPGVHLLVQSVYRGQKQGMPLSFQGDDAGYTLESFGIDPGEVSRIPTRFKVSASVLDEYVDQIWSNPAEERGTMASMSEAARELALYITNDGQLYGQQHLPIIKNLITKIGRGTYDSAKAVKLFMYLCESGAKKYVKEFGGGTWHKVFTVADRKQCAEALRDDFETEAKLGGYDEYLPKKYRAKKNPTGWSEAAHELLLYIDNDGQLYDSQHIPIIKNLMRKIGKGTYDREKAVKLFMYLAESGAKKYVKEFGGGAWHQVFTVADRKQVATFLRDDFEREGTAGGYDHYAPQKSTTKKYRAKKNPSRRASTATKQNLLDEIYASPFLMAYFAAMLWAETADDGDEDDDSSWESKGYTLDDFETKTLAELIKDAQKFLSMPEVEQALLGVTKKWQEQAGHDFWLTRQGHGAGFLDGHWSRPDEQILADAAEVIGECWLYGANGKIHLSR